MRLRVVFGFVATHEVVWWKPITDFPNVIKYLGKNYEWVTYDDDPKKNVDYILTFSPLSSYDPNYSVECLDWKDVFKEDTGCDCGAKHSRSFPWDHMKMCRLWKPW